MASITMKELLEAGVHFGHQTKRWNPKMKEYIFGERNGIYIIDLQKTLKMFKEASKFVTDLTSTGKLILFVGTKRQAQDAVAEEATRAGMPYINSRWLGGLLTNWITVQKSVKRLAGTRRHGDDGRYELLTKKEVIKLERERKHLAPISPASRTCAPAGCHLRRRLEQRSHRRRGSPQARHPGRRRRRHQLRSDCRRLRHPGQRRRPARHPPVHHQDGRFGVRGCPDDWRQERSPPSTRTLRRCRPSSTSSASKTKKVPTPECRRRTARRLYRCRSQRKRPSTSKQPSAAASSTCSSHRRAEPAQNGNGLTDSAPAFHAERGCLNPGDHALRC